MTKKVKKKDFDCVEMKKEIQEALMKEYEARRDEFKSFVDFLNAKSEESLWQRGFREKVAKAKPKTSFQMVSRK